VSADRKPVYFAHKLRGATETATHMNRQAASLLVAQFVVWAERQGEPIAPVCAWIHLAEYWSEAEGRALGLVIDCSLIDLVGLHSAGELWLIGGDPTTSEGMQIEVDHALKQAIRVVDYRGERQPKDLFGGANT
jgi:hypothetical protein